jgi:hypothetical protein
MAGRAVTATALLSGDWFIAVAGKIVGNIWHENVFDFFDFKDEAR